MTCLLGACVPTLGGEYGHDLAESPRFPTWPCRFDPMQAYRPLIEARRMGFGAVAMWLCEGGEGIRVDDRGTIVGVSERLLESIAVVQEAAHLHGLYLCWTLLDGGAPMDQDDAVTRAILGTTDGAARFAEHVVAPIARRLDPATTLALEIVTAPEAAASLGWDAIGHAITRAGEAARAEAALSITAGTAPSTLGALLRSGAAIDALDVHVSSADGALPSRDALARLAEDERVRSLPLIFGRMQADKGAEDALPRYVDAARASDARAAFVWKLEGELLDPSAKGRPLNAIGHAVTARISGCG